MISQKLLSKMNNQERKMFRFSTQTNDINFKNDIIYTVSNKGCECAECTNYRNACVVLANKFNWI